MKTACLLMALGFVLVCRGVFSSAFWYADQNAEPFLLWGGIRVFPGTPERAVGILLLIAGMTAAYRAR